METYYTAENFILYILMLLVIILLVPLAVVLGEGKRSSLSKSTLGCFITAAALYPLSRTCPYEEISIRLSQGSLLFLITGFFALITILFLSHLRGKRILVSLTPWEADRWITRTLQGSYLVMDKKGMILGGELTGFSGSIPSSGSSFQEYLDSHIPLSDHLSFSNDLSLCLEKGVCNEGTLSINEKCYRWFFTPLGDAKTEGYLFSMLDITEENQLLDQRKKQERLLSLRLERIREQGVLKAQEEKVNMKVHAVQHSTGMIKIRLEALLETLEKLTQNQEYPKGEALIQAVNSGEKTMESIRKTVHAMDGTGREKT